MQKVRIEMVLLLTDENALDLTAEAVRGEWEEGDHEPDEELVYVKISSVE